MANTNYSRERTKEIVEKEALKRLRPIAHKNFAIANKRIRRLQKDTPLSPALRALQDKRGGNLTFTQGGKSLKALEKELSECYSFLNLETSTVAGTRRFMKNVEQMTGTTYKDKKRVGQLFDLLHAVQERLPQRIFGEIVGSDPVMKQIIETIDDRADIDLSTMRLNENEVEDIVTNAINKLTDMIGAEAQKGVSALNETAERFNKMF